MSPFLLLALLPCLALALDYPPYTHLSHPFHTQPRFTALPKTPCVVSDYMLHKSKGPSTSGAYFLPHFATYQTLPARTPFATNLDALYLPHTPGGNKTVFLRLKLRARARVFLLLSAAKPLSANLTAPPVIKGLPPAWAHARALTAPNGTAAPLNTRRIRHPYTLPATAAAVELTQPEGQQLILPPRARLSIDGNPVKQYALLFALPDSPAATPRPFPYQQIPKAVKNLHTGKEEKVTPVKPNEDCPEWVHDLYMAPSRDAKVAHRVNEPAFWRTWHPPIDPFFWCYFPHEHGSFPGKYQPMFGYTPWKTPDSSTGNGRQEESNGGFKVFAIPLHEQEKFVVIVVHMHLAVARRFFARHHTVIFAVLDKQWNLELEFHMKADFGVAMARARGGEGTVLLGPGQKEIYDELTAKKMKASRMLNVLNVDDKFPGSVDTSVALNIPRRAKPSSKNLHLLLVGATYEKWNAPLNNCVMRKQNNGSSAFSFDSRNAGTAKRTVKGGPGEKVQQLRGSSENRILRVGSRGIEVGLQYCDFFGKDDLQKLELADGVFYTDPYFSELQTGPGKNSVRQYIRPRFKGIKFTSGNFSPVDPWSGYVDLEKDSKTGRGRRFMNPEQAFLGETN